MLCNNITRTKNGNGLIPVFPYKINTTFNNHQPHQSPTFNNKPNGPSKKFQARAKSETLEIDRNEVALRKNLVQNEALALAGATADGDNADGALDELEGGDGLGVHPELALVVAVHEVEGAAGADGDGGGGGRGRRGGAGGAAGGHGGAGAASEAEHLHHLAGAGKWDRKGRCFVWISVYRRKGGKEGGAVLEERGSGERVLKSGREGRQTCHSHDSLRFDH